MSIKTIVLGCGMIGKTMARDLAEDGDFDVTVADISDAHLQEVAGRCDVQTVYLDLSDSGRVSALVAGFDLVVGGVPSRFGLQTLRAVIEAGKPYCDITFMVEDAMQLDELARARGVTAVVDCGVSPGLSNLAVGDAECLLDDARRAVIYVGGLPKQRSWPFDYKAPFAPADVIEEYTRPARLREGGKTVVRPALSEPELIDLPRAGTLEAFNTDGLRSLLDTVDIPDMKEKTLRYPGHIELMRVFRETGLFSKEKIDVGGVAVRPLDLTSKLLFPMWAPVAGEDEFTVLRVVVEGQKDGRDTRVTYDLYDEYDHSRGESSMARTTAFPNVIVARMVADGRMKEPGVYPPELLARREGMYDAIVAGLAARGVTLSRTIESMD